MKENNNDHHQQLVVTTEKNSAAVVSNNKRKRIRSRISKEEDVCFCCYDGGDLVLCDLKDCPKVYHHACTGRDRSFFQNNKYWKCSRHYCNNCEKNAYYLCFTCTYSLCQRCIREDELLCVRRNKGFCKTCMETVMLIENNELGYKEKVHLNVKDRDGPEYLFTDYWTDLKEKLSITSNELIQARNRFKGSIVLVREKEPADQLDDANHVQCSNPEIPSEALEVASSKRRTASGCSKYLTQEECSREARTDNDDGTSMLCDTEWARKELLDFISYMRDGDTSVLSQFEVQAFLLKYIKQNKLRDPHQKSQIMCDSRLKNLFGKACIGHFEMFRHLRSYLAENSNQETHVQARTSDSVFTQVETTAKNISPRKEVASRTGEMYKRCEPVLPETNHDYHAANVTHSATEGKSEHLHKTSADGRQKIGEVGEHKSAESDFDDTAIGIQLRTDGSNSKPLKKIVSYTRIKSRRKDEHSSPQTNLDDYAAIDAHNIGLLYLRRKLLEDLLEDIDKFHDNVVGSFVRIRIDSSQKQDMHRLVQVVDTVRAPQPYKTGGKETDVLLKILNLSEIEVTPIVRLSDQEFSKDECNCLRESMRCGSISQMTVGKFQEKAIALHRVKVDDLLEKEKKKTSSLCDWANETGRRKEVKTSLKYLQVLCDPKERSRRLLEIPEVHADPNMGPRDESGADRPRP